MKVTKAMGRAALAEMKQIAESGRAWVWGIVRNGANDGLNELGWCSDARTCWFDTDSRGKLKSSQVLLALAMVVTLSGIEP